MNRVGVAAVGDVLDINCWSNIPYYFFTTGVKHKVFHQPWRLHTNQLKIHRYLWNARQFLIHGQTGGFQYSDYFLDLAERQIPSGYFGDTVISFNQLFPRALSLSSKGGRVYYYIDATLYDLFHLPGYAIRVPEKVKQRAIALEKENYAHSEAVVTMGRWIHKTLREVYQVPDHKLFHILPGANFVLPQDYLFPRKNDDNNRLVLGFVGKDWKRKGLVLLRQVQQIMQQKGYEVIIKVIGNCPEELLHASDIQYCGFINKQTDTEKFINEIASCDIGCLFSTDEALGISVLEFLRVGVPVAGFFYQGMEDTLLEGASFRFSPSDSAESIALAFEKFLLDNNLRNIMNQKARDYSQYVTWDRCIEEWKQLLQLTHTDPEG